MGGDDKLRIQFAPPKIRTIIIVGSLRIVQLMYKSNL